MAAENRQQPATRAEAEPEQVFLAELRAGIDENLAPGARAMLAVSGGPDSVALLFGWSMLASSRQDSLAVAHFDHGLREDSGRDADFVRGLANRLCVPCRVGRPEIPLRSQSTGSLEETARNARYAFLAQSAREAGASFVATGHTADDQAETVLHAVIRGSGIHGLAGMPVRRPLAPGVELVRPMLAMRRSTVHAYLHSVGQPACADATNLDPAFTRNRIRRLLPILKEQFNPRIEESLLRLSRIAGRNADFLRRHADGLLDAALESCSATQAILRIEVLAQAEALVRSEAVRRLLVRQGWPRGRIGFVELERIDALIVGAGATSWDLPDGLRAERRNKPTSVLVLTAKPASATTLAK